MKFKASFHALVVLTLALGAFTGCSKAPARTDAQIVSDVQGKFYSDPAIESRQIQVQAAGGVVTLSGNVGSEGERDAAAADAATIADVRTVVNNLQVQEAQGTPPSTAVAKQPPTRSKRKPANKRHGHHNDEEAAASDGPPMDASNLLPDTAPEPQQPAPPAAQAPPPSAPVPPPPPQKITVPAGTQLTIRLNEGLDSERNQIGDAFHGSLSAPIVINGATVIPSGADVVGRVADVKSAGRFAGSSVLTLELTSVSVSGKTYNIQTNQWSREGNGKGKNTATKVGVGTAAGAVLGGIIGGGRGAAIGAASGAGAGTATAAAKKGQQIKLAPEAVLNFQIINPLVVIPQGMNYRDANRMPVS